MCSRRTLDLNKHKSGERGIFSFFFVLHKLVPIFESVDQMFQIVSNDMTVTTVQHFLLVLFIALHKVVATFQ